MTFSFNLGPHAQEHLRPPAQPHTALRATDCVSEPLPLPLGPSSARQAPARTTDAPRACRRRA